MSDRTEATTGPADRSAEDAAIIRAAAATHRRHKVRVWAMRLLLVAVWLGSWEVSARFWIDTDGVTHWSKDLTWKNHAARWFIDPFFFSQPSHIWQRLVVWFTEGTSTGTIWEHIGYTLMEAAAGFVVGSLLGVILGILLGRARFPAEVMAPFIKAGNAVPRIVLSTIFVIWFGTAGPYAKISSAVVLVFFPVFFNAFQGAREVQRTLVDNARILGASRRRVLTAVVIPSSLSWILTSLHVAFGLALIGAVVGEYLGGRRGLGTLIQTAGSNFQPDGVFAGMLILGVLALVAEWVITVVENRLFRWRPPSSGHVDATV